jgi:hypothetical protein
MEGGWVRMAGEGAVCSVQCAVCSVQCGYAVYSVGMQCAVCSE